MTCTSDNGPNSSYPITDIDKSPTGDLNELYLICAEAYQVICTLSDQCSTFDHPNVQKILDNLCTYRLVHDDVLPFVI